MSRIQIATNNLIRRASINLNYLKDNKYTQNIRKIIDENDAQNELSLLNNIKLNNKPKSTHKMICQIIRSASKWSVGLDKKDENSILEAYYNLIDNSKHYILIENQFFVSRAFDENDYVINKSPSEVILNE